MVCIICVFFFKQKTAYEMRISDWSSDVCSSDLADVIDVHIRPRDIDAIEDDLAAGRGFQPVAAAQHAALAGPGRTYDADQFARQNLQVNAAQNRQIAIGLLQPDQFKDRRTHYPNTGSRT